MNYNVNQLMTAADCDAAITMATKRKATIVLSQSLQNRDLTNQGEVAANAAADLLIVNSQLVGAEAALPTLPEGDRKTKLGDQIRRLDDKKGNLEARIRDNGNAALLDTQLDSGLLEAQVAEIDTYIAALQTRKAAI